MVDQRSDKLLPMNRASESAPLFRIGTFESTGLNSFTEVEGNSSYPKPGALSDSRARIPPMLKASAEPRPTSGTGQPESRIVWDVLGLIFLALLFLVPVVLAFLGNELSIHFLTRLGMSLGVGLVACAIPCFLGYLFSRR